MPSADRVTPIRFDSHVSERSSLFSTSRTCVQKDSTARILLRGVECVNGSHAALTVQTPYTLYRFTTPPLVTISYTGGNLLRMDEFRRLLAERSGYPRHGALIEISKATGVALSQLSSYLDPDFPRVPQPAQLRRLAPYLQRPYNDLLTLVYGDQDPPAPLTPRDQVLRSVDAITAAAAELRSALLAITSESQPRYDSKKKRSSTRNSGHYDYQERAPGRVLKFPHLGVPVLTPLGAA